MQVSLNSSIEKCNIPQTQNTEDQPVYCTRMPAKGIAITAPAQEPKVEGKIEKKVNEINKSS